MSQVSVPVHLDFAHRTLEQHLAPRLFRNAVRLRYLCTQSTGLQNHRFVQEITQVHSQKTSLLSGRAHKPNTPIMINRWRI